MSGLGLGAPYFFSGPVPPPAAEDREEEARPRRRVRSSRLVNDSDSLSTSRLTSTFSRRRSCLRSLTPPSSLRARCRRGMGGAERFQALSAAVGRGGQGGRIGWKGARACPQAAQAGCARRSASWARRYPRSVAEDRRERLAFHRPALRRGWCWTLP